MNGIIMGTSTMKSNGNMNFSAFFDDEITETRLEKPLLCGVQEEQTIKKPEVLNGNADTESEVDVVDSLETKVHETLQAEPTELKNSVVTIVKEAESYLEETCGSDSTDLEISVPDLKQTDNVASDVVNTGETPLMEHCKENYLAEQVGIKSHVEDTEPSRLDMEDLQSHHIKVNTVGDRYEIVDVLSLKGHPCAINFFEEEQKVDRQKVFMESINQDGVTQAIHVNENLEIIDGYRRLEACKSLRIERVRVKIKTYDGDLDAQIKDMVDDNILNRGTYDYNPMRFARFIPELERIYRVYSHGGDRSKLSSDTVENLKKSQYQITQKELASRFKRGQQYFNRLRNLTRLIDQFQDAVESGVISVHKACMLVRGDEVKQQKLLSNFRVEIIQEMKYKELQEHLEQIDYYS